MFIPNSRVVSVKSTGKFRQTLQPSYKTSIVTHFSEVHEIFIFFINFQNIWSMKNKQKHQQEFQLQVLDARKFWLHPIKGLVLLQVTAKQ